MAIIGRDIEKAKQLIIHGDLVALPTETVYGLAGNGLNTSSILKIFEAKKRPHYNPLILHIGSMDQLEPLVKNVPPTIQKLLDIYWPGPLTVLLDKSDLVPDLVTAGSDRVAIRIPDHPLTLDLLRNLDFPLAAPSANPFTYISPTTAQHVNQMLGEKIPYILDGGPCSAGLESTIIGMEKNRLKIYRLGAISLESISDCMGSEILVNETTDITDSPGQLKLHYSPHTPTQIFSRERLELNRLSAKKIGMITFAEAYPDLRITKQIVLSESGNLREAATNLYRAMHELDRASLDLILVEKMPETDLGRTMNDRIQRACNS